jgi:hypothetical protein
MYAPPEIPGSLKFPVSEHSGMVCPAPAGLAGAFWRGGCHLGACMGDVASAGGWRGVFRLGECALCLMGSPGPGRPPRRAAEIFMAILAVRDQVIFV